MENKIPFGDEGSHWIWSSEGCSLRRRDGSPSAYEVRRFRRVFDLEAGIRRLCLHVSADSRYVLYFDGEPVGRGPARGDVRHQFFDTYELPADEGAHCLALLVLDYSPVQCDPPRLGAPAAVMTRTGGLVAELWAEGPNGVSRLLLRTDESWRVAVDRARRFQPGKLDWFGGFVGHFEHFVAAAEDAPGWERPEYDDGDWEPALELYPAERAAAAKDAVSPYGLMERMVPQERHFEPLVPAAVFAPGGAAAEPGWDALLLDERPLELAADSSHTVLLELGEAWTGFPELSFEAGAGSRIRIGYAEALRLEKSVENAVIFGRDGDSSDVAIGFADDSTGWTYDRRGSFEGFEDIVEADGREWTWTPHHWRTAKFLRLRVETAAEPIRLTGFRFSPCHYPLDGEGTFRCSDERLERVHAVSLHTLRLGIHETFVDCPYFEQLQYIGDSALNAQVAMLADGAYPLVRQLLYHFDWSRVPEGWTQSRYPSRIEGIIPAQSLDWIAAIHAYGLHCGDLETVGEVLPGALSVLDAYERCRGSAGLPEDLPYWNWIDWCPGWKRGVPPGAEAGPVLSHAAKYGIALRQAAEFCRWLGRDGVAAGLEDRHASLRAAARERFWTGDRFRENTVDDYASRLGNAYAVLAGFHEPEAAPGLARLLLPGVLPDCSYFGYFFVREALWRLDACDLGEELQPWFHMLDLGLSTWAEDTVFWRSLCHGWSANPVIDFHTRLLGVRPVEPGFARARFEPATGACARAGGSVATPHGRVSVEWDREAGMLEVGVPEGVELETAEGRVLPAGSHRLCLKAEIAAPT